MSISQAIPQQLLQGCLMSDPASQQAFYKHFHAYALSICLHYTASREEALDVLNEGFLKVFTRLSQYDPTKSLKGWIRRILINTALDAHRKQQLFCCYNGLECVQQQTDPTALDQLSYQEIMAAVQKLSPAYRAVFNLFVLDGFTHEEIAAALRISIGTSKSNLFRARAQLQKQLKQQNRLPGQGKDERRAAG